MQRRSREMHTLYKKITGDARVPLIGRKYRVLVTEKGERPGEFKCRNINYVQVIVHENDEHKGSRKLKLGRLGSFVEVKITSANKTSLFGEVV
jgi:tRNA A37 methylthiotransferase MiaB